MKPLRNFLLLVILVFCTVSTNAQIAEHIHVDNEPVDFFASVWNIILYILLPIFLIIGGIVYFRKRKKRK